MKDILETFNKDQYNRHGDRIKAVILDKDNVYIDTGREIWHLWMGYSDRVSGSPLIERIIVY